MRCAYLLPPHALTLAALAAVLTSGCASPRIHTVAELRLDAVQRPSDVAQRWGEYEIRDAEDGVSYSDELLELVVAPTDGGFAMAVHNRSEHTIRLLWDDGAVVGLDGRSSGVAPGTASWMQLGSSHPPEVIPSGARAEVVAIATMLANRREQSFRSWVNPEDPCEAVDDSEVRLVLPFEVEGVVQEYTLVFDAAAYQARMRRFPGVPEREEQERWECGERPSAGEGSGPARLGALPGAQEGGGAGPGLLTGSWAPLPLGPGLPRGAALEASHYREA